MSDSSKKASPFSRASLMTMPLPLLRAVLRERTHHSFEYTLYRALFAEGKLPPGAGAKAREVVEVCRARGLPSDLPDIQWANRLLELASAVADGGRPAVGGERPEPFTPTELAVVERLLWGRRSIRLWLDQPVPAALVDRVVDAGLWAPHACNLQCTRVIVIGRDLGQRLLPGGETRGADVYLVVGRDLRPYEFYANSVPLYNRGLDLGAAVQNMLLMAHALGLGAVWGTFDEPTARRIRDHFQTPDYIELVTYVAMGWPAEQHLPPGRLSVEEAVIARG